MAAERWRQEGGSQTVQTLPFFPLLFRISLWVSLFQGYLSPVLPFLFCWNPLVFPLWGDPCFFEVFFPFFSRDLRGLAGIEILVLFGGSPWLKKKKKLAKGGQGRFREEKTLAILVVFLVFFRAARLQNEIAGEQKKRHKKRILVCSLKWPYHTKNTTRIVKFLRKFSRRFLGQHAYRTNLPPNNS